MVKKLLDTVELSTKNAEATPENKIRPLVKLFTAGFANIGKVQLFSAATFGDIAAKCGKWQLHRNNFQPRTPRE